MAAVLSWSAALATGALIGDISPTRGALCAVVGLILLAPFQREDARILLCASFGGLLLVPSLGTPWPWLPLVVAAILRYSDRKTDLQVHRGEALGESRFIGWSGGFRLRLVASVAGAMLTMVALPFLGGTTVGEIGAVAAGCLLIGLGAPTERLAGAPLALIGAFGAAQGYQLGVDALTQPIAKIAPIAASRGADRLRPLLAARAARSLRDGDHADAVHVIRAFPSAQILGEKLAMAKGVPFAVGVGWMPDRPVDSSIAVELAWALQDSGHSAQAVAVLGPGPGTDFHRAILTAEQGGAAFYPDALPEGVLRAPGSLIEREEILENEEIQVFFAVEGSVSEVTLQATGQPFLGPPELCIVLRGEELDRVKVEEEGGSWTFERQMPRGVYRLVLRYENDHHSDSGDRNLYGVTVSVR